MQHLRCHFSTNIIRSSCQERYLSTNVISPSFGDSPHLVLHYRRDKIIGPDAIQEAHHPKQLAIDERANSEATVSSLSQMFTQIICRQFSFSTLRSLSRVSGRYIKANKKHWQVPSYLVSRLLNAPPVPSDFGSLTSHYWKIVTLTPIQSSPTHTNTLVFK